MTSVKRMLWLLVLSLVFFSCEDKMDEHYEEPGWLKGSAWKVLEEDGNYTIFLKGIERAGFKQIVDGKNIMTIMAPTDDAFKAYFASLSPAVGSLDELSDEEVKKLIGFHLMYYSYGTDRLINFRPQGDGVTEEEAAIAAGLYYKHRTRSADPIEKKEVIREGQTEKATYSIYHSERLLPVFSYKMFETKGIDAATNYEYFYPGSTWTGLHSFNVSNASVIEEKTASGEVGTVVGNGYLYKVDKVIEPLETIYKELENRKSEYSRFLSLYDNYAYLEYDADLSTEYGNGDSLWYYKHNSPLVDIACEWPVNDYRLVSTLASQAYTVFAPSNAAIDDFFSDFWAKGGYASLDEVSPVAIAYMLYNCVYSSLAFPEEIKNGKILNAFNTQIAFDVDAVPASNRKMCSNGMLYALKEIAVPAMFKSVTGPIFQNKNYSNYLYTLDRSGMAIAFSSDEANFTLLVPQNEQFENYGYLMSGNALIDENNEGSVVASSTLLGLVNLHTVSEKIDLGRDKVYKTNSANDYWFVKDGKLTTNTLFNRIFEASAVDANGNPQNDPNPFLELTEIPGEWTNGKAYTYRFLSSDLSDDYEKILMPVSTASQTLNATLANQNDKNFKYYWFSQLLKKSGLSTGTEISWNGYTAFWYFIPTNAAFEAAIAAGKIPGVGTDGELIADANGETASMQKLYRYMSQYLVPMTLNGLSKAPYIGGGMEGFYKYPVVNNGQNYTLQLIDNGSKLSVACALGNDVLTSPVDVVDTYNYFPFVYKDGCVHFLNDVLPSVYGD